MTPDLLVESLNQAGAGLGQTFHLDSTSDLYAAVKRAAESRFKGRQHFQREINDQNFFARVLARDVCRMNTQSLAVGDQFKVRRDTCQVTGVDPDTMDVDVKCSPKFGRQRLPDNRPFSPDACRVISKT